MATIIQIPGALEIAGNIPDILLDSELPVNFKLLLGAETLLDETYDPDATGRISIRLRDILPTFLSVSIPDAHVYEQTGAVKTFTFDIDGVTSNHTVVAGGVNGTIDATTFLAGNWLTWQLQQKRVKYLDPEYLSYYATETATVELKAYFATGDPVTISLANLTAGKLYTLDVNFQYLTGLFEGQPVYFDIWTEDASAVRLSFVQRYVLHNDYFDQDDIFVFENSLGGIDTVRFTGEKEEDNKFDISSALFDEDTIDFEVDYNQVFRKKTGFFASDRERVWANEFFNSTKRYLVTGDGLKQVTLSDPKASMNKGDNASINYEFRFALSKQTKYLNLARSEELPENVEIIDPEEEVFFLAPRLIEFPAATINELLVIPVQDPFSQEWKHLAYSSIISDLLEKAGQLQETIVGSHNHDDKYVGLIGDQTIYGVKSFAGVIKGDTKTSRSIPFVSGFAGTGFKLFLDDDKYKFEIDDLVVRNTLKVNELEINKVRAIGGSFLISSATAVIHSIEGNNLIIDTDGGNKPIEFAVDDFIWAQQFTGRNVSNYLGKVTAVYQSTELGEAYITVTNLEGTPWAGAEILQKGNSADASRQSMIYITASDSNNPYIDLLSGVNDGSFTGKQKVRLGNLTGIIDAVFGELAGYGLFGDNVYLKGKLSVAPGSLGYENLDDKPDLSVFALENDVAAITANLQAQIDGQIMTFFDTYVPSLTNAPANTWATNADKDKHLGDLFYNKTTGLGYRFSKTDSVYSWELLKDTDVALALANAAEAQDTADGKRRVFTAQPTTPYDVGDLWSGGPSGELMKCKTARASGAYLAADWEKAAKYTDDTAVNNLQIGGRNLLLNSNLDGVILLFGVTANLTNVSNTALPSKQVFTITEITKTIGDYVFYIPVEQDPSRFSQSFIGREITISFYIKTNYAQVIYGWGTPLTSTNIGTSWLKVAFGGLYTGGNIHFMLNGQGLSTVEISSVKIEFGNKPTDWTPAPEDLDYLTSALQNNTTIQGGLLSTTLLRLGAVNNAGTWVEKAGINGLVGNDDTPRFWAGGTLAQAIARVAGDIASGAKTVITEGGKLFGREVELFGSMATAPPGVPRILIDHASQSIIIFDASNNPKSIITSQNIPSLETLLAGNSNSVSVTKVVTASASPGSPYVNNTQYTATLTLSSASSNYKVTTPPIVCSVSVYDDLGDGGTALVYATLIKPDLSEQSLGTVQVVLAPGNFSDSLNITIPQQTFYALPSGDYKIKLYAFASEAGGAGVASASISIVSPNNILSGESIVEVSRIYRDGMFLIHNASHYHYISPTKEIVKNDEIKGFGVLAAAVVSDTGVVTNTFNSIGNVGAASSGLYVIGHNLGHTNYSVVVTPESNGDATAIIESRTATICNVRLRLSGTGTNMPFSITIFGRA